MKADQGPAGCIDSEKSSSSQENLRLSPYSNFSRDERSWSFRGARREKKPNKEIEVFAESKQIESGIK